MRKMIEMGMMLQTMSQPEGEAAHSHDGTTHAAHDVPEEMATDELLTSLESQLSEELEAIASTQ